jgi:teichuronic acid biosynthesis protein TuaE
LLLIIDFITKPEKFYQWLIDCLKFGWFLVILILWAFLSLIWAVDWTYVPNELFNLTVYVLFSLFSLYILKNKDDFDWLVKIWIFTFILSILVAIWEIKTGNHLITSQYYPQNYISNRLNRLETFIVLTKVYLPTSFYGNQNDFSTYIVLSLPILFYLTKNNILKILTLFSGISIIIFAVSRANLVGLILQLLLLPLFQKKKFNIIYIPTFFLIIVLSILGIYYISQTPYSDLPIKNEQFEKFYDNIRNKILNTAKAKKDFSTLIRKNLYLSSLEYFWESKELGVGVGQLRYLFENKPKKYVMFFRDPHNFYLEILVKFGIITFTAYLFFIIYILLNTIYNAHNPISKAIILSVFGFLVGSISPYSLILFYPLWAFIIFSISYIKIYLDLKS